MLSSSTSGYQRYWTNSVPAHSLARWSVASAVYRVSCLVAALIETYQRPDGSIEVPEVLRPYLGHDAIAKD